MTHTRNAFKRQPYMSLLCIFALAISHHALQGSNAQLSPENQEASQDAHRSLREAVYKSSSTEFYNLAETATQHDKDSTLLLAVLYEKIRFFCCFPPSIMATQRLLIAGANPQFSSDLLGPERSPLRVALNDDLVTLLDLFIQHDPTLANAPYEPIGTLLYGAIHKNQPKVVRLLLQKNAPIRQLAKLPSSHKINGIDINREYTPQTFAQALLEASTTQSDRKKYTTILALLNAAASGDNLPHERKRWLCLFS